MATFIVPTPASIDSIPDREKGLNHWAVWKTEETESGINQNISYYTRKRHASVSKPETWLPFDKAVILLSKYSAEFEGLSFVRPVKIVYYDSSARPQKTDAVQLTYYKIRGIKKFLKREKPHLRGGCQ